MILNLERCLAFVGGGSDGVLQWETQTSMSCMQHLTEKSDNTLTTAMQKNQMTNPNATWQKLKDNLCRTAFIARINSGTYPMTASNKHKHAVRMFEFESLGYGSTNKRNEIVLNDLIRDLWCTTSQTPTKAMYTRTHMIARQNNAHGKSLTSVAQMELVPESLNR